jgi:hypothetical protein
MTKKPITEAQRQAGRNYYNYKKTMQAFRTLLRSNAIPDADMSIVITIFDNHIEHVKLTRKVYTLCPTCKKLLTGRAFRADVKHSTHAPCDICKAVSSSLEVPTHAYTSTKYTLAEALDLMHSKHPELFL